MNVPAEVPETDTVCSSFGMEQQLRAAQEANRPNITNDSELPGKGTDPAELSAEVPQSDVCIDMDQKQQPISTQDTDSPNITNDNGIPGKDTYPAGEKSESDQKTIVSPKEHSTGSSGDLIILDEDLPPEVLQPSVDHISVNMEEKLTAAQDDKRSHVTNDSELPGKDTDPAVNVHVLVAGETFQTHETFIQKLKLRLELCSAESCNVILVFCPVVSRIGTDMEAAMAKVTVHKPVILVFMHHCHNPRHMTKITLQQSWGNIEQVVHCAFHESKGLLQCQENDQAVKAVHSTLLRFCRSVDVHNEVPQSKVTLTQLDMEQQPMGTQNAKRPYNSDSELHRQSTESVETTGFSSPREFSQCFPSPKKRKYSSFVKVHVLVAGETFNTHDNFIKKLESEIELCSAESSSVILVFCPVVSQIGTDMEAAMDRVTVDKPVILVFMHHCHNPRHMTNIIVQPCKRNIVQVVHCAFHETYGLLRCQENEQAVAKVQEKLKKYK